MFTPTEKGYPQPYSENPFFSVNKAELRLPAAHDSINKGQLRLSPKQDICTIFSRLREHCGRAMEECKNWKTGEGLPNTIF